VHDTTTLQHVDPLPQRLAAVGAGYVGLEFAAMFAHFGSDLTLLNSAARLPHEDPDVAHAVG
jgi:probable pyridine nucleotide-disulfide oxidoreductase